MIMVWLGRNSVT